MKKLGFLILILSMSVVSSNYMFVPKPSGPSFSPLDLPGLQLWLDATDNDSLTLSGETVVEWADKSGNDHVFEQETEGTRPTRTATGLAGKQGLDFSGSQWLVQKGTSTNFFPITATYFASVVEFDSINNNNGFPGMFGSNKTKIGGSEQAGYEDFFFGSLISGFGTKRVDVSYTTGTKIFILWTWDAAGTDDSNYSVFVNGSAGTVLNASGFGDATTISYVGRYGNTNSEMDGRIGEIILGHGTLTAGQITDLSAYISSKWD